ncbi:hypothetical protein BCR33DRAFT_712178 [Rhizoclosmatium globosum]|uniref:Uncharacterized protein n=1 Tax=Rhizoclosmatium globosum TaxID=329046 RepID=A0A1Y2CY74_9FUNG|nr:hypothetical protein BCR33DRAFT_712178 [Rhizoclosmatium globosum]|eukprot:ORY51973.1 hypothetical protein BCR33DRAFT_712178 [Rhizoclosmatium globosum]
MSATNSLFNDDAVADILFLLEEEGDGEVDSIDELRAAIADGGDLDALLHRQNTSSAGRNSSNSNISTRATVALSPVTVKHSEDPLSKTRIDLLFMRDIVKAGAVDELMLAPAAESADSFTTNPRSDDDVFLDRCNEDIISEDIDERPLTPVVCKIEQEPAITLYFRVKELSDFTQPLSASQKLVAYALNVLILLILIPLYNVALTLDLTDANIIQCITSNKSKIHQAAEMANSDTIGQIKFLVYDKPWELLTSDDRETAMNARILVGVLGALVLVPFLPLLLFPWIVWGAAHWVIGYWTFSFYNEINKY